MQCTNSLLQYPLFLVLLFNSCDSKNKSIANYSQVLSSPQEHSLFQTSTLEHDSVPLVYLDELDDATVAGWFYQGDTVRSELGTVYGLARNPDFDNRENEKDLMEMMPQFSGIYEEDGVTKTVIYFIGDYGYQHGHTFYKVDVLFFAREKNRWRFLDTLQLDAFDVGELNQVSLCKYGIATRTESEWANMGGFSRRETYWAFQHEKLVVDLSFWTYSARSREVEPYDMVDESEAKVLIKEIPDHEWNEIYYYSEKYDCSQTEAEDNLSYCSSRWVFTNGSYHVFPLNKREKPNKN